MSPVAKARRPRAGTKDAAQTPRRPGRSSPRPRVVVETRVSQLAAPKLLEWVADVEEAIPRVLASSDGEAVHDLRVALRRIRSLLRLVRRVFGGFHVNLIRRELARVADATGSLRDEEVLEKTLDALDVDARTGKVLSPWKTRRRQRLKALQTSVIALLRSGALLAPLAHLRALLSLPCDPERDREVRRFARQAVLEAQAYVDECRGVEVDDVAGMHVLRIAYKRLRYSIDAFAPVLPPELRAWRDVATRFQSLLGDMHDLDVAVEVIRRTSAIAPAPRAVIVTALQKQRDDLATRYLESANLPA